MEPDRQSILMKIIDAEADVACMSDSYLEAITGFRRCNLAEMHYELCLEFGLNYIGPRWHFLHFGEHIMNATADAPANIRREWMETNCRAILRHCFGMTVGSTDYFDVLTKRQLHVRGAIERMILLGLYERCNYGFHKNSHFFCSTPLPEEDLAFQAFVCSMNYEWMIDSLFEHKCVCADRLEVLDQFVYDLYDVWKRNGRVSFKYNADERKQYPRENTKRFLVYNQTI